MLAGLTNSSQRQGSEAVAPPLALARCGDGNRTTDCERPKGGPTHTVVQSRTHEKSANVWISARLVEKRPHPFTAVTPLARLAQRAVTMECSEVSS